MRFTIIRDHLVLGFVSILEAKINVGMGVMDRSGGQAATMNRRGGAKATRGGRGSVVVNDILRFVVVGRYGR
jgi:hypothetical protein